MRILMISDVFFPRINGVSTSIKLFRQTLIAMGHHVSLIVPDYGSEESEPDIYRIPSRKVILDSEDRMMSIRAIMDYLPQLESMNFDLIHIHTPFVAHYAGLRLAKKLNIPTVETYHTFFEEYLYHYFSLAPKSWMRSLARHFTQKQCNAVNAVITPSIAMRDVLVRYGVENYVEIIPTGIELNELKTGNGRKFKQQHGIDIDRPVLVHVGRVAHEKNISFLLKMMVDLIISKPDVLLIIAGEGPARKQLIKEATDLGLAANVLFIGYLSRDRELLDCYCAGDAFVFASRTETQGLVLLEAMALGVPVVSTAVMGTRDILLPEKGAIVSREKAEEFSKHVQRILSDKSLHAQLAKEAIEYVNEWTAEAMTLRVLSLYSRVTSQEKLVTSIKAKSTDSKYQTTGSSTELQDTSF